MTLSRLATTLVVALAMGLTPVAGGTAHAEGKAAAARPARAEASHATAAPAAPLRDDGDGYERASRRRHSLRGTLNLNTADGESLEMLPGIGASKSARILAWRQAHGGQFAFKKIDDLDRVKGFGRKTVKNLKAYLTVTGPTTLAEDDGALASDAL